MTDPAPHGCTIGGQPAMPILISEYNQLTADLARAAATVDRVRRLADEHPVAIDTAHIHAALAGEPGLCEPADPAATQATDGQEQR